MAKTDTPDDTSILLAAYSGTMEFIVPFLQAGGPATYADRDGSTLLHAAADGWQFKMVEFLILSGAEVNAQNQDGDTPLHWVTSSCEVPSEGQFLLDGNPMEARSKTFAALLLRGAKTEMKNNAGAVPLHLAAWNGDIKGLNILAVHTSVDVPTTKGATALVLAVLNNHVSCAECLLRFGADIHVQLPSGQWLSEVIRSSSDRRMRALLDLSGER